MSLLAIINHYIASDEADAKTKLEQLTHTCGFTRGWRDPNNTLLIWYLVTCPVDPVVGDLRTNIANFVVAAYNNHIESDMHLRTLAIISEVRSNCINWLNLRTTEEVALYIQQDKRLNDLIIQELVAQGAVA